MINQLMAPDALAAIVLVLLAIAVMLLSIGVRKLSAETAALRCELLALGQGGYGLTGACLMSIDVAPGDTLMLTTERRLTFEQHAFIRAQVEAILPGLRTVVLDGGLRPAGVLAPVTTT